MHLYAALHDMQLYEVKFDFYDLLYVHETHKHPYRYREFLFLHLSLNDDIQYNVVSYT